MADDRQSAAVKSVGRTACLIFATLTTCYLALAPCTTAARGYTYEDMQSGMGVLTSFNAWVKGRPVPPIEWTRHGPIPLLFDLLFIKIGKTVVSPDFVLSLQPILLTAGLLTVLYLWLRKICAPRMSLLLTMIAAFGTMLWPYSYIGLETKQSFFVLLAGYLALANGQIQTRGRLAWFCVIAGLAITSKSTGLVLAPAIAYLVYVQYRADWRKRQRSLLIVSLTIAGMWVAGYLGANLFWGPHGGGATTLMRQWTIDSPYQLFTNVIGIFGSPNKGFFTFAPVLLLSLWAVPRLIRADIAIFAVLVTFGTVALLSILRVTADEVWGLRFMHVAVAPLLLAIAAAWPRFDWRIHLPVVALGLVGVAISFLGAFFYYGERDFAAAEAGQNTLEWFSGDKVWNEITFDGTLFRVWLKGGTDPALWTPDHVWAWTPPPGAPPWKTIDLRRYAEPQSFLLLNTKADLKDNQLIMFRVCLLASFLAPLLLAWSLVRTLREQEPANISTEIR